MEAAPSQEEALVDPPMHGQPWTRSRQRDLLWAYSKGYTRKACATHCGRTVESVEAQLNRLGVISTGTWPHREFRVLIAPHELTEELLNRFNDPACTTSLRSLIRQTREGTLSPIPAAVAAPPTIKEFDMSAPNIETKTFISGIDAAELSDEELYKRIAQLEAQVETLSKVKTKPKKLAAKIESINADIAAIAAFVDSRP